MPEECAPLPYLCPLIPLAGDTQGPDLLSTCAQGHGPGVHCRVSLISSSQTPPGGLPSLSVHTGKLCAPRAPERFPGGAENRENLTWLPASPPEPRSPEVSLLRSVSTAPASVPLRPHPSVQVLSGQEAGVVLH